MIPPVSRPSRDDVLDAFSAETDAGGGTLERYLALYPEYALGLIDLSREMARGMTEADTPLSADEERLVQDAWRHHEAAAPRPVSDPFASLSVQELREVARQLGVPRQVLTALRERRVLVESVPRRFLGQLATLLGTSLDAVAAWLGMAGTPDLARSYKATDRPAAPQKVAFQQVLSDAQVPSEMQAALLFDED